jgi:predicted N-formylglutamate amidohydrolase
MPGREPPVSALITAEHASNAVPPAYRRLFGGAESVLASHRAWDPGTRELAREMAQALGLSLLEGQVTRLLVDLNRSLGHPRHLSEFSRALSVADRSALIDCYWQPHWQGFADMVARLPGQVVHVACHSFTPVLDGKPRITDIGLLYDPARLPERDWCQNLKTAIIRQLPGLRVRMNYPYRGTSNGLGQQHRRRFGADKLISMELEVNTALVESSAWVRVRAGLVEALVSTLGTASGSR